MGKKNFTSILGPLVEKPQGRPTLVPVAQAFSSSTEIVQVDTFSRRGW